MKKIRMGNLSIGSPKWIMNVMIAAALCAVITVSGILSGATASYAAEKKQPLKVDFCGKTATLMKDVYQWKQGSQVKIKTIEKKWGKPGKKEPGFDNGTWDYTWKKGKTSITMNNYSGTALGDVGGISIEINDKNASIYGVKVGMKKDQALKNLKKAVGSEKVIVLKEGEWPTGEDKDGCLISLTSGSGEATGDKEVIHVAMGPYLPMQIELTAGGKVKKIYYMNS